MLNEYLIKLFGNDAIETFEISVKLPIYLSSTYKYKGVSIYGYKYVFILPINKVNLKSYKVQVKNIIEIFSLPAVLCVDELDFYQRNNLINSRLDFVEIGKQLFIPSIGMVLYDMKKKMEHVIVEKFTPQVQLCALFFVYSDIKEYKVSEIASVIKLNAMAISRGMSVLIELGVLSVRSEIRTNYYCLKVNKKDFLKIIMPYLISPVSDKKVLEIINTNNWIQAGYTALSEYTTIVDDLPNTIAVSKEEYKLLEEIDNKTCRGIPYEINVEIWKYNPKIFSKNNFVDKLSLYLSFSKENDERTEEALNELIEELTND